MGRQRVVMRASWGLLIAALCLTTGRDALRLRRDDARAVARGVQFGRNDARDRKGQTAAVAGEGIVIGGGLRGPGASTDRRTSPAIEHPVGADPVRST